MSLFGGRRGALNASATFAGIGKGAPAAGGKPKGDDDEMTAEEKDAKKKEDARKAKNRKAGRDEDDDGPADDDNDGDDGDDEHGDDESDDDEMKRGKKSRAFRARSRERARCAAIFAHSSAVGRLDMCAQLAFGTNLSRGTAIELLGRSPKAAVATTLGTRMVALEGQNAGGSAQAVSGQDAIDANWDAIAARTAVTTRK